MQIIDVPVQARKDMGLMYVVARWSVAYCATVLVGMVIALVTAWALLSVELSFKIKDQIGLVFIAGGTIAGLTFRQVLGPIDE